jgi:outer membrane protein with beta-barrel domain
VSAARRIGIVLVAALLGGSTAAAADEWSIAPFAGVTARTETGFIDLDGATSTRKPAIGVAAAWHARRWVGVEGDLAVLPGFFESQTGLVESSRVTTLSANVLIHPWQARNVRPYATIGVGVVSVRVTDVADVFRTRATLGAINGGIGGEVGLSARFGFRGDVRYFRTRFEDPPPGTVAVDARFLHFWRLSTGVVVRF